MVRLDGFYLFGGGGRVASLPPPKIHAHTLISMYGKWHGCISQLLPQIKISMGSVVTAELICTNFQ